jgi:hypothetical protein
LCGRGGPLELNDRCRLDARWAEALGLEALQPLTQMLFQKLGLTCDDATASDRTRSLQAGNWPRSPSPSHCHAKGPRNRSSCRASRRKSQKRKMSPYAIPSSGRFYSRKPPYHTSKLPSPPRYLPSEGPAPTRCKRHSPSHSLCLQSVLATSTVFGSTRAKRRLQASYAVRRNGPECLHTSHPCRHRLQMPDHTLAVVRRATLCRYLANARR